MAGLSYRLAYNGNVVASAVNRGPTGGVYAFGFFWICYSQTNGANTTLYVYKLDPNTGAAITNVTRALPAYGGNVGFPLMGANDTLLVITDLFGLNNYLWTLDPANLGGGISEGALGNLGGGFPYHMPATPDQDVWFNANGVRRSHPALLTADPIIPGTGGVGGGIVYDTINGFIWACGGAGNPTVIWKIDPALNAVVDNITVIGAAFQDIIFAFGCLWVTDSNNGVRKFDPVTKAQIGATMVGGNGITLDSDSQVVAMTVNSNPETVAFILGSLANNIVLQPGSQGPAPAIYAAGAGGIAAISGNKLGVGFLTGNQNRTTPGWAYLDTPGGHRRHRGGEFWGIVPELANYMSV